MASTTFLDLCQLVRAEGGLQGTGPTAVTGQTGIYANIVEWVQSSYAEVLRTHPWSFLWMDATPSTTAGNAALPTVTDLGRIYKHRFWNTSTGTKQKMTYVPWAAFTELPTQSGEPRYFTRRPDGAVRLWPTPDDVYPLSLEGLRDGHVLVDATDEPLIPSTRLREVIAFRALQHYGLWNEDASAASLGAAKFNMRLGELYAQYGAALVTRPVALDVEAREDLLELV